MRGLQGGDWNVYDQMMYPQMQNMLEKLDNLHEKDPKSSWKHLNYYYYYYVEGGRVY